MTMTLDDVRNLDPDELTPVDQQVIREHKEELTEDEALRYQSFLEEKEDKKEVEEAVVVKKDEEVIEKKDDDVVEKKTDEVVEDKFNERVQEMIKAEVAKINPSPTKQEIKDTTQEIKKLIPDDWDPKGWEEVLEKAVEYVEAKQAEATRKVRSEIDQINDALTAEVDELRSSGEPIPAKDTKEYAELDKELTSISLKYKLVSFKDAYDIYKQIKPKEEIKKEENEDDEVVVEKKDVAKENKVVAKKIGGANAEVGNAKAEKSYKSIRGKTPRQMVSQFLDEDE